MSLRWQCVSAEALAWREFDGELVVRNARTGSTHLLTPFASAVLRVLLETGGGVSVPDLVARLGEGDGSQSTLFPAIEAVLTEFQRLGLAEPELP
jgi:PqqD family protein of HPr-rel-A system